jgi:site-specific recombinase XerD
MQGLVDVSTEASQPYHKLLEEYLDYLKSERNLAQKTIEAHRRFLVLFLEAQGEDAVPDRLYKLSPEQVQAYFVKHTECARPTIQRRLQGALRTFFRFCIKQGYLKRDLTQAIPQVRTYKLSHLPPVVADEDVQKILDTIDRTTPVGRRDFAIIQLLATYGVRGGQVRILRLHDIQWRQSRIRFPPLKGGKEVVEPLTDQVGASLLEYLRRGRPQADYPEVFLTTRAPFHAIRSPASVSQMIARRMRQAEVDTPSRGSHTFRHAFAARMLKRGQSLKTIADMLGHRHINTTFIYTKVDLETLKQLPLDWPEV